MCVELPNPDPGVNKPPPLNYNRDPTTVDGGNLAPAEVPKVLGITVL